MIYYSVMVQCITWLIISTTLEHNGTTSLKLMHNLEVLLLNELSPQLYYKLLEFKDQASYIFCVPKPLSQSLLHCGAHQSALHMGNA